MYPLTCLPLRFQTRLKEMGTIALSQNDETHRARRHEITGRRTSDTSPDTTAVSEPALSKDGHAKK
jgi:hypothetical protein